MTLSLLILRCFAHSFELVIDQHDLLQLFALFGTIIAAEILKDCQGFAQSGCWAQIAFQSPLSAKNAISALHGRVVAGVMLELTDTHGQWTTQDFRA